MTIATKSRRSTLPGARVLRDGHVLYWWAEIIAILAFYGVYSLVRNLHGGGNDVPPHAVDHARQIIHAERWLGIYHEQTIQSWALHFRPLIISANYFYGSFHFIVTIFTGIFLFRKWSDDYPRFRNTLGIATALALVGFFLYPLVPPRLLTDYGIHQGFVDTLLKDPAFWSFNSGAAAKVSNQFAAMPSVHICWSLWCAVALVPRLRRLGWRILAACYPVITLIVIVITANHYFLDAVAGAMIFLLGWFISGLLTRAGRGEPISVETT